MTRGPTTVRDSRDSGDTILISSEGDQVDNVLVRDR